MIFPAPEPLVIPPSSEVSVYITALRAAREATQIYNDTALPNVKSAIKRAEAAAKSYNEDISEYDCKIPDEPESKVFGIF